MEKDLENNALVSPDATTPSTSLAAPIPQKDMTPEQYRAYNAANVRKSRAKKAEKQKTVDYVFNSKTEPNKAEAHSILEERGIKNAHVQDVVYDLLLQAAEEADITPNRFLFQNGINAVLKSYEMKGAQPVSIPDDLVVSELLNRAELFALYDASISSREPELTFELFLEIRNKCKRDCFFLGKNILGKDFAECNRVWSHEFFPQFDPSTLPPGYTQKQMIHWLDSQSIKKDFLLMASRNSFKSSWSHIWLLTLILCLPDVRVLLISESKSLSKDFIGAIRSYFEVVRGQETRFQRLFPEFMISMGDGSVLSLDCPMAHLRLPQSIESTSYESSVAGRRADVLVHDDPISSTSCGNETQRKASIAKHDALKKLREVGGLNIVLGTPWHEEDLYAELLRRNEDDDDKPLVYRIDPAWTLKPEFEFNDEGKPRGLREIEERMVTLLFPERLTWKFLQSELRANPPFFASQNLCIFPRDVDADIRCTFEIEKLREHCRPISFFTTSLTAKTVLSVDTAFSTAMSADFSCLTTIKILKHEGKDAAVVWDVDMARYTYSDLAIHIVQAIDKHRPTEIVIEKDRSWQTLQREIMRAATLRGVILPHIYWKEPAGGGSLPMQKSKRVKALEPLLQNSQLWFVSAGWTDQCIDQLRKFDGITRSSASRKDDFPDSLAIGIATYFPFYDGRTIEKTPEQRAAEQAAQDDWKRREIYKRYFGSETVVHRPPTDQEPEPECNPLFRGPGSHLRRN